MPVTQTLPILLPDWLIDTYGIDLGATGPAACDITTQDAVFSASGDMYVVSRVFCHGVGDRQETDPTRQTMRCNVIARYDRQGRRLGVLITGLAGPDGATSRIPYTGWQSLSALPDGNIAVTFTPDSTYVINAELDTIVTAYEVGEDRLTPVLAEGNGFSTWMRSTPGGRLLCVVCETTQNSYGWFHTSANLVAVGDPAPLAVTRPILQVIAAVYGLGGREDFDRPEGRPYVVYDGAPLTKRNRPPEPLQEQLRRHFERTGEHVGKSWRGPYVMSAPEPVADDLFVLPLFSRYYRGGNKGNTFAFCLIDDTGRLVGTLRGLDLEADSPFAGGHVRVATDPPRGRVYHLNQNGVYAWSGDDWALQAKVSTAVRPYSLLKQFDLLGCSPDGEIVLVHRKQHLILRVPAPPDLNELSGAVADALTTYAKERSALKKALAPTNWYWTSDADDLGHRWL